MSRKDSNRGEKAKGIGKEKKRGEKMPKHAFLGWIWSLLIKAQIENCWARVRKKIIYLQGKQVEDNVKGIARGEVAKKKNRRYRQYMNRRGLKDVFFFYSLLVLKIIGECL